MSVKLFFWNIRDLNDPVKHRPFASWLNSNTPLFGDILESHIKEPSLIPILSSLCPNWFFTSNHRSDPDGKIILIWRNSLNVQILHQSRQSITCRIIIPHKPPIYYTAVYASNQSDERNDLWAELIHLHSTLSLDDSCWFFGGDLNQIIHPDDHSDPVVNAPDYQMYLLRDCMTQLGLFDLRYTGTNHSWTNSQPAHPIAKKLDRLLCNSVAIASYPHALANFLPPNFSGHLPCILDLAFNLPQVGSKPFKFPNYLTKHPGVAVQLQDAWIQAGNMCQTLTQLCWKLKLIKSDLKLLNKNNYPKI